jgi:hypothetical protein
MRTVLLRVALAGAFTLAAAPAFAANDCSSVTGDAVLSARTPEVDLYDGSGPGSKRIKSLDDDKFPKCLPIAKKAPNGMMEVTVDGVDAWVLPNQVNARVTGESKPICRNLAMGGTDTAAGATRGAGEGCKAAGGH